MLKNILPLIVVALILFASQQASAQSIRDKLGVTARIGFVNPKDSDYGIAKVETDVGFIFGGGFIYGIGKNWAAEIDVTRAEFGSNDLLGHNIGDFEIINIALGGQYRFDISSPNLTPYAGAGLDILVCDHTHSAVWSNVDTTAGIHVSGGLDYFITKQFVLNVEGKVVSAPETDISGASGKAGNFDPSNFSGMFGVRYFFN